nr:DKNYY domain-containing protein [uncultured Flavobacterium sp.]
MADPVGIILKVKIEQQALQRFLNSKQPEKENLTGFTEDFQEYETIKNEKVSHFFAKLLYESNDSNNIFLFHYDESQTTLFFAFILNYDYTAYLNALLSIIKHMGLFTEKNTVLLMSPTSGDLYKQYNLESNSLESSKTISKEVIEDYQDTFWSFYDKKLESFPEPEKAIRKRNYFYKPIITAYKKYVAYIEEQLKPQKIKAATKEQPFELADPFSGFCSYDGKVFRRGYYNSKHYSEEPDRRMVEYELFGADPYTFRLITEDLYADKNHLYQQTDKWFYDIFRVFIPVTGIDGATFTYIGNKYEHSYCKDKNHIYYDLKAISADPKTFKDLNFGFGKDKEHVFFRGEIIPINTSECSIDKHGFIRDNINIFHYETKVPLDGATFKVLEWESDVNPFIGTFILEDKNGRYEFTSATRQKPATINKI